MADLKRESGFGGRTECSRLGLRVGGQQVRSLDTPGKADDIVGDPYRLVTGKGKILAS